MPLLIGMGLGTSSNRVCGPQGYAITNKIANYTGLQGAFCTTSDSQRADGSFVHIGVIRRRKGFQGFGV